MMGAGQSRFDSKHGINYVTREWIDPRDEMALGQNTFWENWARDYKPPRRVDCWRVAGPKR